MAPRIPVPVQLHRIYKYAYYRSNNHALLHFARIDMIDPTACPYHGWRQSNKLHSRICKTLGRQCSQVKATTIGRRKHSVRAQRRKSLEANTLLRSRSSSVTSTVSATSNASSVANFNFAQPPPVFNPNFSF